MPDPRGPILLFDGVCTLCDRSVQFILDHERQPEIRFASLQSDAGRGLLARCGIEPGAIDSVVFIDAGQCHVQSDAALAVAARLRPPWRWAAMGRWVPRPIRDGVYAWIARHRYRWFGTREACRMPTPDTRARFLDADEPASSS